MSAKRRVHTGKLFASVDVPFVTANLARAISGAVSRVQTFGRAKVPESERALSDGNSG